MRRVTKDIKERSNEAKKRREEEEVKMNPLKTAVNDAKTKLQNGSIKDCMGKAKTQSEY